MNATLEFEQTLSTLPAVFDFTGFAIATTEGLSTAGSWPAAPGNRLIQRDQDLNIGFNWTVSGALCSLMAGCTWKIDVYVEQMGGSEITVTIPPALLTTPASSALVQNYVKVVTIPANALVDGSFGLVCVLRLFNPANNPLPVAAFGEFPIFTVFTATI